MFVSVIPVLALGAVIGFLASIMGVGGGFIMVPALIYLLKVPTNVVIGTSLFQIIFVAAFTTIIHSSTNQTVDVVLAVLLMLGGVAGAQYGAKAGQRLRGEQLRALLALLVLAVALRLAFDLFVQPADLYSIFACGGRMMNRVAGLMFLAVMWTGLAIAQPADPESIESRPFDRPDCHHG